MKKSELIPFGIIGLLLFLVVLTNMNSGSVIISPLGVYQDVSTNSHEQNAIFEGRSYLLSGHFVMSTGSSNYFLGCTQDKAIHFESFTLDLSATPFDVHFYENPTITSNGSQISGMNLDRNFENNSSLLLYANPTFTNNGTQLFHSSAYGGNNLVGQTVIPDEIILKINTCYLFEIINNDGNNVDVTYNFKWHDSKYNYTEYFN